MMYGVFAPSTGQQAIDDDEITAEIEARGGGVPTACALQPGTINRAYCGRVIRTHEFSFKDAPHAVEHYRSSSFLRLCTKCADEHERLNPGTIVEQLDMRPAGAGGRR